MSILDDLWTERPAFGLRLFRLGLEQNGVQWRPMKGRPTNRRRHEPYDMTDSSRDLFPGALEMMVLRTVAQQPLHGYALAQHIQRMSNDLLAVEEGSLYPALQRMLKARLLKAEWRVSNTGRRVRVYEITEAGRDHLHREVSRFERMLEGIRLVLGPVDPATP